MDEKVYAIIEEITGDDAFQTDLDMDLFEEGLLDSMGAMMLIVELEEAFEVNLPPSEMDRDDWNTARKIAKRIEEKVNEKA
ncbi:MAG: D-alanine--poly(phosphoribitol) ligase subunit DltC [Streptococcaceae bacterium]|nr:D-alanine--poly(phosphoribitol) ligase subunit DltC [Streptococcaceae bacterium]